MTGQMQGQKGQPILFLALLLGGWVLLRAATWQAPWPEVQDLPDGTMVSLTSSRLAPNGNEESKLPELAEQPSLPTPLAPLERPVILAPVEAISSSKEEEDPFVEGTHATGHNLLWLAGMAALPLPREVDQAFQRSGQAPAAGTRDLGLTGNQAATKRWRVDSWLVLRAGDARKVSGAANPATYGGSQLGAILAFRLAPRDARDPTVYSRASKALVSGGETEVAAGGRVRPLPGLPVTAHAELRVTDHAAGIDLRPAVFLSAGTDSTPLPLKIRASGYAQLGAVGGKFATAFVDGAAQLQTRLLTDDLGNLDAGIGAWGGAQKGAARLDLGPTASARFSLGDAQARVSADWRLRVAGNAEPANGAAITLSTGF